MERPAPEVPRNPIASVRSVASDINAARLARAAAIFEKQHARGLFPGGQLVVHVRGHRVLDVAVGVARGFRPSENLAPQAVTPETPFQVFSASKPIVAFAIAVLEDRRELDVHAPVACYFPEFAAHGKADITVLDVLTHRSGIMMREFTRTGYTSWGDWNQVVSALIEARPDYPRGTFAYQALGFGWILSELVRRITGHPLPEFLTQVLPASVAAELRWGVPPEEIHHVARAYCFGSKLVIDGFDIVPTFEMVNDSREVLTAFVPGAGLITTARGLASFYDIVASGGLGPSGERLLEQDTLARYIQKEHAGRERSVGLPIVMGRGFALGPRGPHLYGYWNNGGCAGHAGNFSCLGFAEPARGLSVAIVTNANRSILDLFRRFAPISHALRKACR